jgi:hypothetical protein
VSGGVVGTQTANLVASQGEVGRGLEKMIAKL